jgi:predicted nucleic acid-binding Zn ribbon protein
VSRPAWRPPVRIAEVVPATFQRLGLEARFRQSVVWAVWSTVVGPQIARHAQPHAVRHGRLIVHVSDSVWLHHLSMMRHQVTAGLNEKLRTLVVKELILRVGELMARAAETPLPTRQIQDTAGDPAQLSRIKALLAPLRDAPFYEALHQLLVRAHRSR